MFSHIVDREGCCRQKTLTCAPGVSATLGLPLLTAHSAQALGCSTGNHLRLALGCMNLPSLSCSGSGTQVVLRGADSVGPAFCALPRSEQLGGLASAVAATYRLSRPAAQFSGYTTGAPSQADGDCPEPQEGLVSKEA